jgi:hypothetical protein
MLEKNSGGRTGREFEESQSMGLSILSISEITLI